MLSFGISDESAVHGGFMLLGTAENPDFVDALLGASWYRKFINTFVAGGNGAIGNLDKNALDEQVVRVPDASEQKQIGKFFMKLDNSIALEQRTVEKLKSLKQAYLVAAQQRPEMRGLFMRHRQIP